LLLVKPEVAPGGAPAPAVYCRRSAAILHFRHEEAMKSDPYGAYGA
jgi:hypothetical protein